MDDSNQKTLHSKVTIIDIVNKVIKCLQKAEEKYPFKDSISLSHFRPMGPLDKEQGIWVYPIEPKTGVLVDPEEFLDVLKNEFIPKNKKFYQNKAEYLKVVSSIRKKRVTLKILKKIEKENRASSLIIEGSVHGILKIMLMKAPNFVLLAKLEAKSSLDKSMNVESKGF